MGVITWIIVIVAILAVIGMGLGTFLSGAWSGAQKIGSNAFVQDATDEAKGFVQDAARNATDSIIG